MKVFDAHKDKIKNIILKYDSVKIQTNIIFRSILPLILAEFKNIQYSCYYLGKEGVQARLKQEGIIDSSLGIVNKPGIK